MIRICHLMTDLKSSLSGSDHGGRYASSQDPFSLSYTGIERDDAYTCLRGSRCDGEVSSYSTRWGVQNV